MKIPISEVEYNTVEASEKSEADITKLAESFKEIGQIQDISVQQLNESHYRLTAGLTRLLAAKSIGWDKIGAIITEELNPIQAEHIAIHENLKRKNLEWWQEVKLVQALHELRVKQHDTREKVRKGRPKEGEQAWGLRQTAEELERSLGSVSQDLALAKMVEAHPSLRNVKDKRTALKLIRSEKKRIEAEEDAALSDFSSLPLDEVLLGDSLEVLKHLPDLSVDACVTDPPWLKFQGEKQLEKDEVTDKVFTQVYRLLRFNTFLYAFVGFEDWYYYKHYLPKLGFTVSKTPLIWVKEGAMSPIGVAQWEYSRDFELILLAVKGTPALLKRTQKSGVFKFPIVPPRRMIHPHEKPVPLIQDLIQDCTYEGNIIIDPFAGSGAVLEACRNLKRPYVGVERDHDFFMRIKQRLGVKESS